MQGTPMLRISILLNFKEKQTEPVLLIQNLSVSVLNCGCTSENPILLNGGMYISQFLFTFCPTCLLFEVSCRPNTYFAIRGSVLKIIGFHMIVVLAFQLSLNHL